MQQYWGWFCKLNTKRPSGLGGVQAISYQEMQAFFELYGIIPETDEIEIVEMFDRIAVEHMSKEQAKAEAKQRAKAKR